MNSACVHGGFRSAVHHRFCPVYTFSCANPPKAGLVETQIKRQTTQERLDVKTFIFCKYKKNTEHNCGLNLMAVNLIYVVGRCADALFQAQIYLLPDSSPTSLAKLGIMALQLERNQSCSEILCHPIFSFLLMGQSMCKQHIVWLFEGGYFYLLLFSSYSHWWPTLFLWISFKEVKGFKLLKNFVFCCQVTQFGLQYPRSSGEDSTSNSCGSCRKTKRLKINIELEGSLWSLELSLATKPSTEEGYVMWLKASETPSTVNGPCDENISSNINNMKYWSIFLVHLQNLLDLLY